MARFVRGLIVDYGGVLTTDVFASFRAFCEAEGLRPTPSATASSATRRRASCSRAWRPGGPREPIRGGVAELIGVGADGLIDRMFGHMAPDEAMIEGVLRGAPCRGAHGDALQLLGRGPLRPRAARAAVRRVGDLRRRGVRKPDPAIYALAVDRIGVPADACVFVDDLPGNLKPARALGMGTSRTAATPPRRLPSLRAARRQPQPALIATTPASVTTTPTSCERATRSASTTRASTTVTAG